MFDFLKKFMISGYLSFKDDYIKFGNEKMVFYFVPHLVDEFNVHSKLFGLDYGAAQFLVGRMAGYDFVKRHGSPIGKNLTQVIETSQTALNALGWGKFSVWKADENKEYLLIKAEKSTIADEIKLTLGPQETPVDFLLSGLFAGATSFYCKSNIYCIETMCRAQRNVQMCEFFASTDDRLLHFIKEFSPDKVNYASSMLDKIKKLEKASGARIEKTEASLHNP
jgi:predicted hydrocarbon binding protein